VSEVVLLKIADIDSQRMLIRVEQHDDSRASRSSKVGVVVKSKRNDRAWLAARPAPRCSDQWDPGIIMLIG